MRIAEWDVSKYLVVSSCTFLIPCVYAYTQQLYTHSAVIAICTVASINFWRDAVYSYRRTADVVCARASILWGIYECIQASSSMWYIFEVSLMIGGTYVISKIRYRQKHPHWLYYHIAFHLCTTAHALYGLYLLKRYK